MQFYEIRMVRQGKPTIISSRYVSDYAAVRSARAMAAPDDAVEIWRDAECIYRDHRAGTWRFAC